MPTERRQHAQQLGRASNTLRGTGVLNLPALFAVDGSGGAGRTTLLLHGAHDCPVRGKFHYFLVLGLGKVATQAKILADIAVLVNISGGEALAAKIRALPAGEHQMQTVVNLLGLGLRKPASSSLTIFGREMEAALGRNTTGPYNKMYGTHYTPCPCHNMDAQGVQFHHALSPHVYCTCPGERHLRTENE
jgi:hypothetical protein